MDERLAAINERVAAAVDAWLRDPRDAGVYERMVAAVEARRAHLSPPQGERPTARQPDTAPRLVPPPDERVSTGTVQRLGTLLGGDDPRAALERLRRGG
ncbi:hypothetical protein [Motilibacter aurantiacus]|uniref:hypothetical protein n=1 Tax=Motilibacter aurantiacus TaxID=2714955 RepID=UPI001E5E8481|nr:hypothetical protein [Motilibacter aurantiacus]